MAIALRYGFNLGQIEGLDSSVKTVTLTVTDATESHVYTLQHTTDRYDNNLWTDDIDTGLIHLFHINGGDTFGLDMANFTESDIGDTYNIKLSIENIDPNFKAAVEEVIGVSGGLYRIEFKISDEYPNGYLSIPAGELYEFSKKGVVVVIFISEETLPAATSTEINHAFLHYASALIGDDDHSYYFEFQDGARFRADSADAFPVYDSNS